MSAGGSATGNQLALAAISGERCAKETQPLDGRLSRHAALERSFCEPPAKRLPTACDCHIGTLSAAELSCSCALPNGLAQEPC